MEFHHWYNRCCHRKKNINTLYFQLFIRKDYIQLNINNSVLHIQIDFLRIHWYKCNTLTPINNYIQWNIIKDIKRKNKNFMCNGYGIIIILMLTIVRGKLFKVSVSNHSIYIYSQLNSFVSSSLSHRYRCWRCLRILYTHVQTGRRREILDDATGSSTNCKRNLNTLVLVTDILTRGCQQAI